MVMLGFVPQPSLRATGYGLYLPADRSEVPECYRNIGIRIEEDVLIVAEGNEVLSDRTPKTVADIESWMSDDI